jgi:hypothetical protein
MTPASTCFPAPTRDFSEELIRDAEGRTGCPFFMAIEDKPLT